MVATLPPEEVDGSELEWGRSPVIFLADDEPPNLMLIRRTLASYNYTLRCFEDGRQLLDALDESAPPDLVITDVRMPRANGFQVCEEIKTSKVTRGIPVIIVTGLNEMKDKVRGLEAGADEFLHKPFHPIELRARVRALLRTKKLHDLLEDENARLEEQVRARTIELEQTNQLLQEQNGSLEEANEKLTRLKQDLQTVNIGLVAALEKANELNDNDTGNHIRRVCAYSEVIARSYGLDSDFCARIRLYASLHDVGKVGIPDHILKKPGKFTAEEFEQMKQHTILGYELLKAANADTVAMNVALAHHEKYDGSGYPYGLVGEEIPVEARIVALADVWDALTSRRCYKESFPEAMALSIVREDSGKHFDPRMVELLLENLEEFRQIRSEYADNPPEAAE